MSIVVLFNRQTKQYETKGHTFFLMKTLSSTIQKIQLHISLRFRRAPPSDY
jgi:hypothetical protein